MTPSTALERTMEHYTEKHASKWDKDVAKIYKRFENLQPASRLPPLPSPVRGVAGCKREVNVAFSLRDAIEKANLTIHDGQEKYVQFLEGYTDKKLISDAKDALDLLMIQHIGKDYGKLNWKTASRSTHKVQCEAVIRHAAASRDFIVFRQTAFLWAIRDLTEQKMKSKGRGKSNQRDGDKTENIDEKRALALTEEVVGESENEAAVAETASKRTRTDNITASAGASTFTTADGSDVPNVSVQNSDLVHLHVSGRGRGRVHVSGGGRGLGRGRRRGRGRRNIRG